MAFDKQAFGLFCVGYVEWLKAIKKLAPPPPPGFFWVLHQGAPNMGEWDSPMSPLFSAFFTATTGYEDKDLIPMWVVYMQPLYERGKKVPVKVLAQRLGISPRHFYDTAHEVAEKLYKRAFIIMEQTDLWYRFEEQEIY